MAVNWSKLGAIICRHFQQVLVKVATVCCLVSLITIFNINAIITGVLPGLYSKYSRNTSCRAFLSEGHFEDNDWRPNGCRMHHYNKSEVAQCLIRRELATNRRNYFLFAGDSLMLEQFYFFVYAAASKPIIRSGKNSLKYSGELFDAEYVFDRYMDYEPTVHRNITPSFVIFGSTVWFILRSWDALQVRLRYYNAQMNGVAERLDQFGNSTKFILMQTAPLLAQFVYSDGCSVREHPGMRGNITCKRIYVNTLIRQYNDAAIQILSNGTRSTYIWTASRKLVHSFAFDLVDATHLSSKDNLKPPSPGLHLRAQMLLNFHCNRFMDKVESDGGLCCTSD